MLQAVIFDMDDTLIDWSGRTTTWQELTVLHLRPIHRHLNDNGHRTPPIEEFVEFYIREVQTAWERVSGPDWVSPRQDNILYRVLDKLKVNPEQHNYDALNEMFDWGPVDGVEVFPDVPEVLQELRQHGVQLGMLTNAAQSIQMRDRELEAYGLRDYFEVRKTAGDIGVLKPHPRPFQATMEAMSVQPDEALYVGDRLHDDVGGAQAAGMRAVWVRRDPEATSSDEIRPNAIIDRMTELLDVLDLWYPGWRINHG